MNQRQESFNFNHASVYPSKSDPQLGWIDPVNFENQSQFSVDLDAADEFPQIFNSQGLSSISSYQSDLSQSEAGAATSTLNARLVESQELLTPSTAFVATVNEVAQPTPFELETSQRGSHRTVNHGIPASVICSLSGFPSQTPPAQIYYLPANTPAPNQRDHAAPLNTLPFPEHASSQPAIHIDENSHRPLYHPATGSVCEIGDRNTNPRKGLCAVCSDRATGVHHGAPACEGCKGFFRRSVMKRTPYTCPREKRCEITRTQRNKCQYCRFLKCARVGMRLRSHNTEELLTLYPEMADTLGIGGEVRVSSTASTFPNRFTENEIRSVEQTVGRLKELINVCHRKALELHELENPGDLKRKMPNPLKKAFHVFSRGFLCHAEFQFLCDFAVGLEEFCMLPVPDQSALMRSALLELAILRLCEGLPSSSRPTNRVLVTKWSAQIDDADLYNTGFADSRSFVDCLFNLEERVANLAPDEAESGLMMAIILFTPDRDGLVNPVLVHQMQESWIKTLRMYCECTTHSQSRYARLLRLLPTIHELSEKAKQNMSIRWANMGIRGVGYMNSFINLP